jgi:hypothetical protein
VDLGAIGLGVSRYLAGRFGGDRQRGLRLCSREAARLLGVRSFRRFTPGERLAWKRWAPVVLALPGIERWRPADKQALTRVIRAKGGRRESVFVRRFDAHAKLRAALFTLSEAKR